MAHMHECQMYFLGICSVNRAIVYKSPGILFRLNFCILSGLDSFSVTFCNLLHLDSDHNFVLFLLDHLNVGALQYTALF